MFSELRVATVEDWCNVDGERRSLLGDFYSTCPVQRGAADLTL